MKAVIRSTNHRTEAVVSFFDHFIKTERVDIILSHTVAVMIHIHVSGIRYQVFLFTGEPLAIGYYKWHPERKENTYKEHMKHRKSNKK